MKRVIFYIFLLSIAGAIASGIMGYHTVATASTLVFLLTGFTGFYLICRYSYRVTSQATRRLKTESKKAYSSFNLYCQLEKFHLDKGVQQYHAVNQKSRNLLRLIRNRFVDNSLTQLRFRQEVDACVNQVVQNLEQVVCQQESLSVINSKNWRRQMDQLQKANADQQNATVQELQRRIESYELLKTRCAELLSENDQLLEEMDKTVLAMSQQDDQPHRTQDSLVGEDAFMHQYLFRSGRSARTTS